MIIGMGTKDEEREVKAQVEEIRGFAAGLSATELKDGSWFAKLLQAALETYTRQVNWEFFARKYPGLPVDAIVDRQIELAQRYAMIEGGLSAAAYSAAIAATVGTAGGASPLSVPAAVGSFAIDLAYVSRLQLRLAYDLAILYRHPIDPQDPEDLYDLLRVAFGIKAGEALRGAVPRLAPEVVRQGVKAVVKGPILAALKALPIIGKFLLQRNIIKFAIPVVCVPAAMKMNHYFTGQVGRQAREVFRDKAAVRDFALRVGSTFADNPTLLLHTVWYVVDADSKIEAAESWLLRAMIDDLRETPTGEAAVDDFERMLDFDRDAFLAVVRTQSGDTKREIFKVATETAIADRELQKAEIAALERLASACGVPFDVKALRSRAKDGISGRR